MAFAMALILALAVHPVQANEAADEQLARTTNPTSPVTNDQFLKLSGVCDAGAIVMKVKNISTAWKERGTVRIINADSGQTVRERHLSLALNQTASYRMEVVQGARYRVAVSLPGGTETITRTFVDRCSPAKRVTRENRGSIRYSSGR